METLFSGRDGKIRADEVRLLTDIVINRPIHITRRLESASSAHKVKRNFVPLMGSIETSSGNKVKDE